jgi:hypothetical protein
MTLAFSDERAYEFTVDGLVFKAWYEQPTGTVAVYSEHHGETVRNKFYGITEPQFNLYVEMVAEYIIEEAAEFERVFYPEEYN